MKRLDDGKVTLVDFLRSIKFGPQERSPAAGAEAGGESIARFADFRPHTRTGKKPNNEDAYLVRSGN